MLIVGQRSKKTLAVTNLIPKRNRVTTAISIDDYFSDQSIAQSPFPMCTILFPDHDSLVHYILAFSTCFLYHPFYPLSCYDELVVGKEALLALINGWQARDYQECDTRQENFALIDERRKMRRI
jgi:hypothetical protein